MASSPAIGLTVTTGVGAVVSSVKFSTLEVATLPAASVWRTLTVLTPSVAVKVVPQTLPLVLYSTTAPASTPLSVRLALLLILSLVLLPLSQARLRPGVAMVLSMVRASNWGKELTLEGFLATMLTLPLLIAWVGVTVQLPSLPTTVDSISLVPGIVTSMRSPAVPVPLMVGVSSLVMRSVVTPELLLTSSLATNAGARVSTAYTALAAVPVLPASSV